MKIHYTVQEQLHLCMQITKEISKPPCVLSRRFLGSYFFTLHYHKLPTHRSIDFWSGIQHAGVTLNCFLSCNNRTAVRIVGHCMAVTNVTVWEKPGCAFLNALNLSLGGLRAAVWRAIQIVMSQRLTLYKYLTYSHSRCIAIIFVYTHFTIVKDISSFLWYLSSRENECASLFLTIIN